MWKSINVEMHIKQQIIIVFLFPLFPESIFLPPLMLQTLDLFEDTLYEVKQLPVMKQLLCQAETYCYDKKILSHIINCKISLHTYWAHTKPKSGFNSLSSKVVLLDTINCFQDTASFSLIYEYDQNSVR